MYGICNLSIIPGRAEPSDKSEMFTQVLFGEHFSILEDNDNWCLIRLAHDNYKCWVDKKQMVMVTESFIYDLYDYPVLADEIIYPAVKTSDSSEVNIILGSALPMFDKGKFLIDGEEYSYSGSVVDCNSPITESIVDFAYRYLNTPYLWGGRSPFGIDCSGFTQMAFRLCGIALPRDSSEQAEQGSAVEWVEEAKEGDLAFFSKEAAGIISHVGIVLVDIDGDDGKFKVMHASGKVRIDNLDQKGIYNLEKKAYSHYLIRLTRISL